MHRGFSNASMSDANLHKRRRAFIFNLKKLAASCAAVASLAMFGLSGTAMAVETPTTSDTATASITLNASEGNTPAGKAIKDVRAGDVDVRRVESGCALAGLWL